MQMFKREIDFHEFVYWKWGKGGRSEGVKGTWGREGGWGKGEQCTTGSEGNSPTGHFKLKPFEVEWLQGPVRF